MNVLSRADTFAMLRQAAFKLCYSKISGLRCEMRGLSC